MRRKVMWLTFWVTLVFWFGQGCGPRELNEANRLQRTAPIPGVNEVAPFAFAGEPSITSMDRSDWPRMEIRLARQVTQTRPVYWESQLRGNTDRPRLSGEYPTLESAVDLGQDSEDIWSQIEEGFWDPIAQLANLGLAPVRLVTTSPTTAVEHSPLIYFALLPQRDSVVLYPVEEDASSAVDLEESDGVGDNVEP